LLCNIALQHCFATLLCNIALQHCFATLLCNIALQHCFATTHYCTLSTVRCLLKKGIIMPQLDKVTFLSQFFWLCFFYFGFYLILVKHFLPRMSRLLKLRQAKIGNGNANGNDNVAAQNHNATEQSNLRKNGDLILLNGAKQARNSLDTTLHNTSNWVKNTLDQTNRAHFKSAHTAYVLQLQNIINTQNTIQMLNLKAVLSPRSNSTVAKNNAALRSQCGTNKEAFYTKKVLNFLLAKRSKKK